MDEARHLSLSQTFGSPVRRDDGQPRSFGTSPTFSYAVCPGCVANIAAMSGFVVSVSYYFNVSRFTPFTQLCKTAVKSGLGSVLGLGLGSPVK